MVDLLSYLSSECDHTSRWLENLKGLPESNEVRNLDAMDIPKSFVMSYLTDYYDGCMSWDPIHTKVIEWETQGTGRLVFRKRLSSFNPDAIDIWVPDDGLGFLILDAEIVDITCIGDYVGMHDYYRGRARITPATVPLADDRLKDKILAAIKTPRKRY